MKPSLHNISAIKKKVPSKHNGGHCWKKKRKEKEAVLEKIKIKYFLPLIKVRIDVKPRAVLT